MKYTVSKLANLSGISSRTLRYYDQIGLLSPAHINSSGYRIYEQKEVDQLQQILFFRELGFSLEEIKTIIKQSDFDHITALKSHHVQLKQKKDRLSQLIATVEKTIASMEEGTLMQNNEKFTGFKEKLIEENEKTYGKEIRSKYGNETIDASNAKLRNMSPEDYDAMVSLEKEIHTLLGEAIKTEDPASDQAKTLAKKHKQWLMYSWPNYSKEAHAGLAEMYVADDRFTAYYDNIVKGGAIFLRDAIFNYVK